jgi:hypothetical protein
MSPPTSAHISIEAAQEWYLAADVKHHSALRDVINLTIDKGIRTEFDNDSYPDALVLTSVMFDRARKSIRMLSGGGCEMFLTTIRDSFESAVDRLSRTGGSVKIVMMAETTPKFVEDLKAKYPKTLETGNARLNDPAAPIAHFVVCDSTMARIEKPHPPLTPKSSINDVQAKVYYNDPSRAAAQEARFNGYWEALFAPQTA